MNKKMIYLLSMIGGVMLVISSIITSIVSPENTLISLYFINAGTVILVVSILRYNKLGAGIDQDERTRNLAARALSYSWLISFLAVNAIYWIDYYKLLTLTLSQGLGLILFIMLFTAVINQWIFKRKGIVE